MARARTHLAPAGSTSATSTQAETSASASASTTATSHDGRDGLSKSSKTTATMMPLHNLRSSPGSSPAHSPAYAHTPRTPKHFNITDVTVRIPGSERRRVDELPAARWRTPEFIFYGVVFVAVVPMLVWWPIKLSSTQSVNYWYYMNKLSPGWMYGRQVDASDPQYRTFRNNFGALLVLGAAFLLPSHLSRRMGYDSAPARARFIAGFSALLLLALHGASAVKVAAILGANYALAKARKPAWFSRPWSVLVVVLNLGVLFANWKFDGYRFGDVHSSLGTLDRMGGILPRWHIGFNITMLRLVSFALDYHWRGATGAGTGAGSDAGSGPSGQPAPPADYRSRVHTPLPEEDYTLANFIAYVLYPPLYIAGPIMTFQDFVWQLKNPVSISTRERISYTLRFAFCMLTMESILHTMYVTAIKDRKAWAGDSPADLAMIGFWNLVIVWLKLLIPWRFFRLFALLDGLDPPENMVRCVANNYSTLGFWRSWHRSYNLWLIRYIYVPLGGARNLVVATLLVFTFVALWHDLSFKLLAWGWLVSLFILPEIVGRQVVPASKYGKEWWYRHVAAAGGVFNILLMMGANLVGFVLGVDGMKHLLHELLTTSHGWMFVFFSCACLFVAVQVMFEYREEEARRGIDRRC